MKTNIAGLMSLIKDCADVNEVIKRFRRKVESFK